MNSTSLLNICYLGLKMLHMHPDQKFNIYLYIVRIIWFTISAIVVIMIVLNFLNDQISAEGLVENVNLAISIGLVSTF